MSKSPLHAQTPPSPLGLTLICTLEGNDANDSSNAIFLSIQKAHRGLLALPLELAGMVEEEVIILFHSSLF